MSSYASTKLPAFAVEDPAVAIGVLERRPDLLSYLRSDAVLQKAAETFAPARPDHPWLLQSSGPVTIPPAKLAERCGFMPDGAGGWLSYVVKANARSRRIRVSITPERIELHVPSMSYLDEGVEFLASRRSWVQETLAAKGSALGRIRDGSKQYFDFERRTLQFRGQPGRFLLGKSRFALLPLPEGGADEPFRWEIWLPVSESCEEADAVLALKACYKEWGRAAIDRCFARAASRAKAVPPMPWRLSSARTRWGSCTIKGQISLTWALAFLDDSLIEYVCAHELAHLLQFNHSPAFWVEVEAIYPDWEAARERLKSISLRSLPFA